MFEGGLGVGSGIFVNRRNTTRPYNSVTEQMILIIGGMGLISQALMFSEDGRVPLRMQSQSR